MVFDFKKPGEKGVGFGQAVIEHAVRLWGDLAVLPAARSDAGDDAREGADDGERGEQRGVPVPAVFDLELVVVEDVAQPSACVSAVVVVDLVVAGPEGLESGHENDGVCAGLEEAAPVGEGLVFVLEMLEHVGCEDDVVGLGGEVGVGTVHDVDVGVAVFFAPFDRGGADVDAGEILVSHVVKGFKHAAGGAPDVEYFSVLGKREILDDFGQALASGDEPEVLVLELVVLGFIALLHEVDIDEACAWR